MHADPAAQRRLLDLAEVDAELSRVAHRRRSLPELAEVEAAERELQASRDAVVTAETRVADLDRDIGKLEAEIDQVRARESRNRSLLDSGSISSAKQLEDLQHELATLARRQTNLEDDLLEVMEQRETTESELQRLRASLAETEQRLADASGRRNEALADLDFTETRRLEERGLLVAGLPGDLLALYERVRARGGTGAAPLRHRRCGACRLELDRNAIAHLRDAPADSVQRCEECDVVLVRTDESGL
ncbi:MAG: hypothetical protein M3308_03655 [Actinomycetota bacterium]|nr:hypothetical protein [Actinomycetota bacterium]